MAGKSFELAPLRTNLRVGRLGRLFLASALVGLGLLGAAAAPSHVVVRVPIHGIIDLGLAAFVERCLDEAVSAGAAAVVLDVNTFGGRVDAAVLIRDALLRTKVPTVAWVNRRAISAGALISLAAGKIAMAGGSTIGAATPVEMGAPGAGAQPVAEKTVSYVRKEFRATAESRGRPPLLAEAMVDADVVVPGLVEKGKLLTLTTDEALKHRLADFRADDMASVLQALMLPGAEVRQVSPNWAEWLVRWLTHPVVSSLLMTVGLLGILIEIRTPGFGVPGLLGMGSLALFFWGHWIVRLAGWQEVLLVLVGLVLLAVEIFAAPGFGVPGVLGIASLLGGLGLSLVGAGATWTATLVALGRVSAALLVAGVGAFVLLAFLPRLPFGRGLILNARLPAAKGYGSAPESDRRWLGKRGIATSRLRPAGIAQFDGERVDVVSEGEFIEAGEEIEVIRVDGNRIVVRQVPRASEKE
ncbi:MAG: nodulation protein NfeD [Deltaproteobacteria bacterium]|nr:nodulation protein NfeD [Deltaproteobacteria bacterium]